MRKTLIMLAVLALALGLAVAGCSSQTKSTSPTTSEVKPKPAGGPTKDNPLVVDKQAKTIKIYAEVNRKYVTEPTRHGIVGSDGSNADKALFKSFAQALDIYQALIDIGAKPGDNVKATSPKGTQVKGTELKYTVSWADKSYDINDLIASSGKLGGKPLVGRFGGNKAFQAQTNTGCIFCLDSCAAGITSNSTVGWMSFDSSLVKFNGVGDKLPADGTPVTITIEPVGV